MALNFHKHEEVLYLNEAYKWFFLIKKKILKSHNYLIMQLYGNMNGVVIV